jgi:hypothetical protein
MFPGFDVFGLGTIPHREWDDGIGIVMIHYENVLVALSGDVRETACEIGVGLVGGL